jgi:trehalose 6-phosphate synthase
MDLSNHARSRLIVASNRGPQSVVVGANGQRHLRRGSGGLVSGIATALRSATNATWMCAAMNDDERALAQGDADLDLPRDDDPGYAVTMLAIDKATFDDAYNGIANSTLWFVLHMLFEPTHQPVFDADWREGWEAYRRYNACFADAIVDTAAHGATVMVQDYHLFLLPAMLRARRPDLRISLFTHTPWVAPDYFTILPDDVARELLEGMLGADLLGFHTRRWSELFLACCREVIGRNPEARVKSFGLTTDLAELGARASQPDVDSARLDLREVIGDRLVIGRVDRTELSKNVLRGLQAYRELLRREPQWRGEVVHVVIDYPSRQDLPAYQQYVVAIEKLAGEIDDEFGSDTWRPLVLSMTGDYPTALACLRSSDVVFVNSIRDGMNLVALEGISLAERPAAVVLSRQAGAAELLGPDAILVNPFDISQTAAALHEALTSCASPDRERVDRLRRAAVALPPAAWFQAQLDALAVRLNNGSAQPATRINSSSSASGPSTARSP